MRRLKARGPGPSGLGLRSPSRSHGRPPRLVNIAAAVGHLPRVDDADCVVIGPKPAAHRGALHGGHRLRVVQSRHHDLPRVEALAAGGLRGLAAASLPPRPSRRPRDGGATRNFSPVVRRHAPQTSGCCGGAPADGGPQARAGCIRASLRGRCSGWPARTAGRRWCPRRCPARLDGHAPTHRLQHYEHSARSCVEGAPTRVAACATTIGVGPRRTPGR
jgi:hypothetical protein